MTTLRRRFAAVLLLVLPATASADILMLDVNIQEGERKAVQKLATEFGADANFVVGAKTKDFLVLLEVEFAKAERGETDVTTIVFSGHSGTGREFYSEDGDRQILIGDLQVLSKKYPKAFSQVRHVMLMGCMAGAKDDIGAWSGLFPNVTLAAGFNGSGPSNGAANRFLKKVMREIHDAEVDAGGADAFAATLANDQDAIDRWLKTFATLEHVNRSDYGFELCGSYLTRKNEPEDTPKRLQRLMNEAYFACRDAERTCTDPSRKKKQLRELYLDTEAHVRPKQTDPTLIDSIQRKVYRLYHYENFKKEWIAKNEARVDDAARKVPGFPDAAKFVASSRRAQIDSISALTAAAGGDAMLESLAADMQREIVDLRDPL